MEKNSMGEAILNHYETYLGEFTDRRIFKGNDEMSSIQILEYDDVFEGCKAFASFGLSKYADIVNNTSEAILAIDDDSKNACSIFANVLFYIVENGLCFGRGTFVEGIENINKEFAIKHNKSAIYFTEPYAFPDEFACIGEEVNICLAFFISDEECAFIKKYGCDKFEDYLEEKDCDIMDLNR